jgi:hypothetical protein
MPITPDTKNWTWVLERACPQCGLDTTTLTYEDVPRMLRANAREWPAVLARPDVRERPDDATWSPLEYGAHVRDVFVIFRGRLSAIVEQDEPTFDNWDQDATAVEQRYAEQDPDRVSDELLAAAALCADAFAGVPESARGRVGHRTDGATFTVDTLARYLLHDPVHHLWDTRSGAARES